MSDSKNTEKYLDKIRGCLVGGAVGDALGFPVEFLSEGEIFSQFGKDGITECKVDSKTRKALVSDDTQMLLFTSDGVLICQTRAMLRGISDDIEEYVARFYLDWLLTQTESFESVQKQRQKCVSWLLDVPELYARRAPGATCISALNH